MPKTGSGKPLESTVGVRWLWSSRREAGMSTKLILSSRVPRGVGSGSAAGSWAASAGPMDTSDVVRSVVELRAVAREQI